MFRLLLAFCSLLIATTSWAHDLWLVPPAKTEPKTDVLIRVNSGMEFPISEKAPQTNKLRARRLVLPDGKETTLEPAGVDGTSGLLKFAAATPGTYIVGVETPALRIEMSAEDFNHYLVADGLPHIYLQRFKDGSLNQKAVERYSKSPKCLVRAGDGPGDPCQPMGLPLEITPLKNPFHLKIGAALPVKVQFRGQPLANANLGWAYANEGELPRGTTRTNEKGEALIPLAKPGLLTIRLTHLAQPKAKDFEWESFWTTLTWLQ